MNLAEYVHQKLVEDAGLRPGPEWSKTIAAAIDACDTSETTGGADLRARAMAEAAARLTVPETHFFRHNNQLERCADHLSEVSRRECRVAQLWCAGTATGEEPYTLAMLVDRKDRGALAQQISVSASDISHAAIEKAKSGTYTSWSFRGAPGWCFSYFEASGRGLLTLRAAPIREVVRFHVESCQNGAKTRAPLSLDVISFRNVAIYLSDRATQELYREFTRLLRPGGLLALGPSDPQPMGHDFQLLDYFDDAPLFVRTNLVGGPAAPPSEIPTRPAPPGSTASLKTILERHREPALGPGDRALGVVRHLTQEKPDDVVALRLLGKMHLARGEVVDATRILRKAVFLDGSDVIARYFFALALREAGDTQKAMKQLTQVIALLQAQSVESVLDDQTTTAAELLSAAKFLEVQWS